MSSILRYLPAWSARLLPRSVSASLWPSPESVAFTLPDEIWTLIAMELEFKDVFNVRLVCRYLNGICGGSVLWRHMFLSQLGNQIPKPFFLPKPLNASSAVDIETAIRSWTLGWTPTNLLQHYTRQVNRAGLGGQDLSYNSVIMTPGGRWVVAASTEGSIWWFDLSDGWTSTSYVEPRILIPSDTDDNVEGPVQIKIAADFFSEESLGAFNSKGHPHQLSRFNIVIMARSANRSSSPTTHVGIWRVFASQESGLSLGECLSSYEETGSVKLTDVSLYGSAVAYGMDSGGARGIICVIIVEWEEANGKTMDDEIVRRYIPFIPTLKVMLLPGDNIFLVHVFSSAGLYNWREDCEPSTLHPSEQEHAKAVTPIWAYGDDNSDSEGSESSEDSVAPVRYWAMVDPLVLSNTIHLVLPTPDEIYGLTIPLGDPGGDAIESQSLLKGRYGGSHHGCMFFGHRHAVGTRDWGVTVFAAHYQWSSPESDDADDSSITTRFKEVSLPEELRDGLYRILYDQFSQRIVITDGKAFQFVTLQNTP
ncbi:hypothetical protein FA13DRAFT_231371 [Coprinellus micaceus]|uniref:F-box domain-containing protein n=1 Tax=Coprinellus micaceus TaxID=71717 RepID=A0A4Y7TFX0_COPMI|nr:hypothetical protein FA13DRAFT_231371 [Coprinellus micaceus]